MLGSGAKQLVGHKRQTGLFASRRPTSPCTHSSHNSHSSHSSHSAAPTRACLQYSPAAGGATLQTCPFAPGRSTNTWGGNCPVAFAGRRLRRPPCTTLPAPGATGGGVPACAGSRLRRICGKFFELSSRFSAERQLKLFPAGGPHGGMTIALFQRNFLPPRPPIFPAGFFGEGIPQGVSSRLAGVRCKQALVGAVICFFGLSSVPCMGR